MMMKQKKSIYAEHSQHDFLRTTVRKHGGRTGVSHDRARQALGLAGRPAPSNRVTVGVIGTGNQGFNDIRSFLGDERVQIVAVCDVNRESPGYWDGKVGGREPARRLVEKHYAENKVRRVPIAAAMPMPTSAKCWAARTSTPSRSARPTTGTRSRSIAACKAGKDIYCQKPLSLTIAEGRAMSYAVNKSQRRLPDRQPAALGPPLPPRLRAGAQRPHRRPARRSACGLPAGRPTTRKTGDRKKPEPVPQGFDYNMLAWPGSRRPLCARHAAT